MYKEWRSWKSSYRFRFLKRERDVLLHDAAGVDGDARVVGRRVDADVDDGQVEPALKSPFFVDEILRRRCLLRRRRCWRRRRRCRQQNRRRRWCRWKRRLRGRVRRRLERWRDGRGCRAHRERVVVDNPTLEKLTFSLLILSVKEIGTVVVVESLARLPINRHSRFDSCYLTTFFLKACILCCCT